MTSCSNAGRYKGARPPTCNGGDPCDRCLQTWARSPKNPANAVDDPFTPAQREMMERVNGPVHTHFGLTYASYLVARRSFLQAMPVEWQERFVELMAEFDDTFEVPRKVGSSFDVHLVKTTYEFEDCGCDPDADDCECDNEEVEVRHQVDDPYSDYRRPPPLPFAPGKAP